MSDGLSDEVKGAIVLEVHSQLNPLKSTVDRLDRTVRSLYSNGSGGPPGYLETARAEDEEWKKELKKVVEAHGEQLTVVADFVKTHNERDKENEERQKKREERWKFWGPKIWQLAGALGIMVSSLAGWTYHEVAPVVRVLWMDYLKEHPNAASEMKNTSSDAADKVYADSQKQDAAIPAHP
jgi:hypothetical protein